MRTNEKGKEEMSLWRNKERLRGKNNEGKRNRSQKLVKKAQTGRAGREMEPEWKRRWWKGRGEGGEAEKGEVDLKECGREKGK